MAGKRTLLTFDQAMKEAALAANEAVKATTDKYVSGGVYDEPEISTYLISQLDNHINGSKIGGLSWSSTIVRNGKGTAAEEKEIGADILLHVTLETPFESYSKGVLIQAKKSEPFQPTSQKKLEELNEQCLKMLKHTPASFVFSYSKNDTRTGSATRFSGNKNRDIHRQCTWTSYRFFLELFRCPIGDPRIISGRVKELPVPRIIHLRAEGELSADSIQLI